MTSLRPLEKSDWVAVSEIYAEGIATGIATFETSVPNWDTWNTKYHKACRIVSVLDGKVIGFAVLSPVSKRYVYRGVAEVSLYVAKKQRGQGIGKSLLEELVNESEKHGFWTLQASIFSENKSSIDLHVKCGFRIVGVRERIGQRDGKWHDNQFLERRSKTIN